MEAKSAVEADAVKGEAPVGERARLRLEFALALRSVMDWEF